MPKTATRQKAEDKTNKSSGNGTSPVALKTPKDAKATDRVNREEAQAENVSRKKTQKDLIKQTDKELLREMLYQMVLGRVFEQKCAEVYRVGKIGGFCHLYIGQEAIAIGTMMALKEGDYVISSYRDHVQAMVAGMTPEGVMAELYGKEGGVVKGKGGSMHMFSKEKGYFGGHGMTPTLVAERRVGESGWDALLDDGGSADETAFDTDETLGSDETLDIDVPAGAVSANLDTPVVTGTATELEWSSLLADGSGVSEPDAEPDFDAEPDTESSAPLSEPEVASEAAPEPAPVLEAAPELAPVLEAAPEPEPEPVAEPAAGPEPAAAPPPPSAADASMISALTAAADNPALQFQASAQLGRLLLRLDRGREAVAWLERATQAPTAVREQRLDVMYELADALEGLGERARALDVFSDLEFDAASFRDVPERMARLRHALDEGRAP